MHNNSTQRRCVMTRMLNRQFLKSVFGKKTGDGASTRDSLRFVIDKIGESSAGRGAILSGLGSGMRRYLVIFGYCAMVLVAFVLVLKGEFVLLLAVSAVSLTLARFYAPAAMPLTLLGLAGIVGYVSQRAGGGLDQDIDAGFFVGSLGPVLIATCAAYLFREDWIGLILAAGVGFLEVVVINVAGFDSGSVSLILTYLFTLVLVLVVILLIAGKWHAAVAGTIGVAAFNAMWLLLPNDSGMNFETLGGGKFEQCLFGGMLLLLAGLFIMVTVVRLFSPEPEKPASGEEAETEEQPVVALDEGGEFIADQTDEIKEYWSELTAEQRKLIADLLEWHLYVSPPVNGNDEFREEFLDESGLRKSVERTGLKGSSYLYFGSRKATTIVAKLADKRGLVPKKIRETEGIRKEIFREMDITPEEVKAEQGRLAVSG